MNTGGRGRRACYAYRYYLPAPRPPSTPPPPGVVLCALPGGRGAGFIIALVVARALRVPFRPAVADTRARRHLRLSRPAPPRSAPPKNPSPIAFSSPRRSLFRNGITLGDLSCGTAFGAKFTTRPRTTRRSNVYCVRVCAAGRRVTGDEWAGRGGRGNNKSARARRYNNQTDPLNK